MLINNFPSCGGKSVSVPDSNDVQLLLDSIKYNLEAFNVIADNNGTHGIIALLAEQARGLAMVVERMHNDPL